MLANNIPTRRIDLEQGSLLTSVTVSSKVQYVNVYVKEYSPV